MSRDGREEGEVSRIRERRPLQLAIRDAILDDYILTGRTPPGRKLPSEHELADVFRASRVTIRSALQSLRDQGYIRISRGTGSHVLPRPESITSGIDRLVSFDELARDASVDIRTEQVEIERVDKSVEHAKVFQDHEQIVRVSRTKSVRGRRVGYIIDYVPESIMTYEELKRRFKDSVLDLLLERPGLVAYTDCTVTPVTFDDELNAHLDEPEYGAFLHMSELTRSETGRLVNRSEAWISPEYFTFQLRRRVTN